jgi:hypothetical protein
MMINTAFKNVVKNKAKSTPFLNSICLINITIAIENNILPDKVNRNLLWVREKREVSIVIN